MKLSVCIATYNGEKYIKEQVDSILKQLSKDDELIISDDGSKDKTLDIIREYKDSRINIYLNSGKHGFVHNFQNALMQASGDVIFLCDQDDVWMDNKVMRTLKELKKYDFVVSDCLTVNEKLEVIDKSRFKYFKVKKGFINLMIRTRYLGCCMAFNRNVLLACLPFPKNDYLMEHDLWIAAVSELYFKTKLIDEQLIMYRRHGYNTSDAGLSKGYSLGIKIIRRLYRLVCLFIRLPKVLEIKRENKRSK